MFRECLAFAHYPLVTGSRFASPEIGNAQRMSIDLHDSVTAGRKTARRARHRAAKTVEAARAVELPELHVPELRVPDLHGSAETAKTVAKHTARRAAKHASAAAHRAAKHKKRTTKHRARHVVRRVTFIALAAGAVAVVVAVAARRWREAPSPFVDDAASDPFGAASPAQTSASDGTSGADGEHSGAQDTRAQHD